MVVAQSEHVCHTSSPLIRYFLRSSPYHVRIHPLCITPKSPSLMSILAHGGQVVWIPHPSLLSLYICFLFSEPLLLHAGGTNSVQLKYLLLQREYYNTRQDSADSKSEVGNHCCGGSPSYCTQSGSIWLHDFVSRGCNSVVCTRRTRLRRDIYPASFYSKNIFELQRTQRWIRSPLCGYIIFYLQVTTCPHYLASLSPLEIGI